MTALDRPAWLSEATWPWPVSALSTPSGRIAVTDVGVGPVVLLSHVGMWSFIWRDLIRDLADDHRVIAFDAPNTGLSERVPPTSVGIESAALALGTLIDALDLRDVTLTMHDIGGPAGIAAVAARSERVARIVAVNTFAWRPTGPGFRTMLGLVGSEPVRWFTGRTNALPAATSTRAGVGRNWSASDRRTFLAAFDRPAREAVHRYLGDARRSDVLFSRTEAALAGPLADRPVLTIFGELNDPLHLQRGWRQRFPDASQEVVRRGLHFPMCDAPGQVAGWLRAFVASTAHRPRTQD